MVEKNPVIEADIEALSSWAAAEQHFDGLVLIYNNLFISLQESEDGVGEGKIFITAQHTILLILNN